MLRALLLFLWWSSAALGGVLIKGNRTLALGSGCPEPQDAKVVRMAVLLPGKDTQIDPHPLAHYNTLETMMSVISLAAKSMTDELENGLSYGVEVLSGDTRCSATHGPLEAFDLHCKAGKQSLKVRVLYEYSQRDSWELLVTPITYTYRHLVSMSCLFVRTYGLLPYILNLTFTFDNGAIVSDSCALVSTLIAYTICCWSFEFGRVNVAFRSLGVLFFWTDILNFMLCFDTNQPCLAVHSLWETQGRTHSSRTEIHGWLSVHNTMFLHSTY